MRCSKDRKRALDSASWWQCLGLVHFARLIVEGVVSRRLRWLGTPGSRSPMTGTQTVDWTSGDMFGIAFPACPEALGPDGPEFLTCALRLSGALCRTTVLRRSCALMSGCWAEPA